VWESLSFYLYSKDCHVLSVLAVTLTLVNERASTSSATIRIFRIKEFAGWGGIDL
jgi:hypothetical protein